MNWRWVEEGDGYVGRLQVQPPGQPLGVGLPSGLQCLVPYPYRAMLVLSCESVLRLMSGLVITDFAVYASVCCQKINPRLQYSRSYTALSKTAQKSFI